MAKKVKIKPEFFEWALRRARKTPDDLKSDRKLILKWIAGEDSPTLKQLEAFAKKTHAPFGMFFLPEPPEEKLDLPDFRTLDSAELLSPSADLLDTLYTCQLRQAWYSENAPAAGFGRVKFPGDITTATSPKDAAKLIRETLGFSLAEQKEQSTAENVFRLLVEKCEDFGVLVMSNDIVGDNTHRTLDVAEFRGFCLADNFAPLIFINNADAKSAQVFTLIHELAHLWIGHAGISNSEIARTPAHPEEQWCNAVAAEFLVPLEELEGIEIDPFEDPKETAIRLGKMFKVSRAVMFRRMRDAKLISQDIFRSEYDLTWVAPAPRKGGGGDYYNTKAIRTGKRFARTLIMSTLEGKTLYRDALRLLGLSSTSTFDKFATRLGMRE